MSVSLPINPTMDVLAAAPNQTGRSAPNRQDAARVTDGFAALLPDPSRASSPAQDRAPEASPAHPAGRSERTAPDQQNARTDASADKKHMAKDGSSKSKPTEGKPAEKSKSSGQSSADEGGTATEADASLAAELIANPAAVIISAPVSAVTAPVAAEASEPSLPEEAGVVGEIVAPASGEGELTAAIDEAAPVITGLSAVKTVAAAETTTISHVAVTAAPALKAAAPKADAAANGEATAATNAPASDDADAAGNSDAKNSAATNPAEIQQGAGNADELAAAAQAAKAPAKNAEQRLAADQAAAQPQLQPQTPQVDPSLGNTAGHGAVVQVQAPAPITTAMLNPQAGVVALAQGAPVPASGLAMTIAAIAKAGKSVFDIRLDPAELGRVDVRMSVDRHGLVNTHITVEKIETLDLLRRDMQQLQRALDDAGLKTGNGGLQFSLRDQSHQDGQGEGNGQGRNSQRLVVSDDAIAAEVVGRSYGRMLGSSSGLDIRV